MRWFSIFGNRSNHSWEPVSNSDECEEAEILMGEYEQNPAECRDLPNGHQQNDHIEPVFHQSRNFNSSTLAISYPGFPTPEVPPQPSHSNPSNVTSCGLPKLSFPTCRCSLVFISLLVILAFIGLDVGLGCYSLIIYKPEKLVIDKSVKSFSIPNHAAYQHFEALMLARKDNSSGRFKRDTVNSWKQDEPFGDEQEALKHTEAVLKKYNLDLSLLKKNSKSVVPSGGGGFNENEYLSSAHRERRSSSIGCMYEYQSRARWKMHVIYLAQGDNEANMFTKERLETAHVIEKKIIEHPGFYNFCLRDPTQFDPAVQNMQGCVPPNSLLTYFFPSQDELGTIYYDGMGTIVEDIHSALRLAMNHETFYYYVDDKINKTYQKSHLLRSEVLFGAPLQGFPCNGDHRKDQDEKFKNFVITYINMLSKASTDKVQVLYGGNEIFDYEVTMSFWSDVRLAIISLIAIFILMLLLSLSLFLTVVGVVIIALSFPISLFFYRVVFGIDALGILNGAAAFVIIGIGVDDVFVFMNIYRQASHISDTVKRIVYTIKTAGVATFFTSFTTAAAFAANIASSIPAVYDFGLFMSLIVSTCWISVFVLMPPALYLYACFFEPIETYLLSCLVCKTKKNQVETNLHSYSQQQSSDRRLYQEDDVPLLDIDFDDVTTRTEDQDIGSMDDDDMLIMEDPYMVSPQQATHTVLDQQGTNGSDPAALSTSNDQEATPSNEPHDQNVCLGRCMQKMLMFVTNHIAIRGRYFVIGFYLAVLCASVYLMSQLHPATHPPQLFRPDTNIQQLLDLKANFTIIDAIHCDTCSAFYKVHPGTGHKTDPPQTSPTPTINIITADKTLNIKSLQPLAQTLFDFSNQTKSVLFKLFAASISTLISSFSSPGSAPSTTTTTTTTTTSEPLKITPRSLPVYVPSTDNQHAPPLPDVTQTPGTTPKRLNTTSVGKNFDPCQEQSCNDLKDRPILMSGATVYVVFGITGVNRSRDDVGHVMEQFKSTAIFDPKFGDSFNLKNLNLQYLKELCVICKLLANNTDLVQPGSAQCVPSTMYSLQSYLKSIPECHDLPSSSYIYQRQAPAHAEGGVTRNRRVIWLAFAFESTTSEGQAYFDAYKEYLKWESLMAHIKSNVISPDSPLQSMFQTSEFWTKVMMEVVAVNSAIYGLVLSMLICVVSVAIFTGHAVLLLIVVITIIAMICCVVGVFYLAGWEMGAVEAVSLSILVGSSVDYCVHIVEGYILAGRRMDSGYLKTENAASLRRQRTSLAVRHIGVAIVCSALTTIIAAVPLTQTYIQPFAKFGSILLINTTVSMVMTLTLAVSLLATLGPARYRGTWRSHVIATVVVVGVVGVIVLALFIATKQGVRIPGPSGTPLFT